MRGVVIAGIGQTPVGELWDISLRSLAYRAIKAARLDAGNLLPQALYVGNFLSSVTSHQGNLGAVLADNAGLDGIESFTVEAASASGGAAFQMGFMAIASGLVDIALVVGAEKFTDALGSEQEAAIAMSMDADYEAAVGLTLAGQAGLLMQRYLHDSGAPRSVFGAFPVLAHANAVNNPNAMYRKAIRQEAYEKADILSEPINLFDLASYADGAAAVILTTPEIASHLPHPLVTVRGAGGVIDTLAIHDRPDPLAFDAARYAVQRACEMAGTLPGEVNLFELDDAFSIYAVLELEAAGFAGRGQGWRMAQNGDLALNARLPVLTMGGSKGRGNPLGAAGVYQIVEAAQQLRGQAGANQVPDARLALTLSLGGPASSAYAHVLQRRDTGR
ncbi:MAG: thiolase domain-containing protein [Chloroflexi bacterium]|nr:MAG: thiolase domain-containing protein [Chloroflexota bacterium]